MQIVILDVVQNTGFPTLWWFEETGVSLQFVDDTSAPFQGIKHGADAYMLATHAQVM